MTFPDLNLALQEAIILAENLVYFCYKVKKANIQQTLQTYNQPTNSP